MKHKFPFLRQRSEKRGQYKPHPASLPFTTPQKSDMHLNAAEECKEESCLHYTVLFQ